MDTTPPLHRSHSPLEGNKQRAEDATERSPLHSPNAAEGTPSRSSERCVPAKMFLLGMGGVFLSHALQGLSAAGVQILNGAMPSFELNLWRVAPVAVFLLPFLVWRGMNLLIPRQKIHILLLLIAAYNTQNITFYYAARYAALGTLSAMQVSLAICFSSLLSICIVEGRSLSLYIGGVVSIVGLIFMAQPTFLGFHHPPTAPLNWTSPCITAEPNVTGTPAEAAAVAAAASEFLYAGVVMLIVVSSAGIVLQANCNKLLVYEGIPSLVISWWTAVGSVPPSIILMFIFETPVILKNPFCVTLVVLHCIGVEQSLIILPWSTNYVLPAIIAMSYATQIIIQLVCQYTFLKDIQPGFNNWQEYFGAVLCITGIMAGPLGHLLVTELRKKKEAAKGDSELTAECSK